MRFCEKLWDTDLSVVWIYKLVSPKKNKKIHFIFRKNPRNRRMCAIAHQNCSHTAQVKLQFLKQSLEDLDDF
jgi:hypothetical protein